MIWDQIENAVTKGELRRAVAVTDELVPVGDAKLDGQRLEELAASWRRCGRSCRR